MLKTLAVASVLSVAFLAAGRTTYSGTQIQSPIGSAFKMAPDPSNIWSFHETYQIPSSGKHSIPVLVDFDRNGKMDTEYSDLRVLVTDISIRRGSIPLQFAADLKGLVLVDDKGVRWCPSFSGFFGGFNNASLVQYGDHLVTPLALPIGSGLRVEFEAELTGPASQNVVQVNLVGRVVTM